MTDKTKVTESLPAAPKKGQCHWPIQGCHVWAYVLMPSGNDLPRAGDPCRCGEAKWKP